jgi:ATP-dependent RNA helicase DOB1
MSPWSTVEVVYHWSKGMHFDEVMKKTDLFEGTVIRAMRRLDELMMAGKKCRLTPN